MAVSIRPEKLREALGAKLDTAVQALYKLREAEKPVLNQYWEPQTIVVEFLHAAHGVFPTIKTFGEKNAAGFWKWLDGWKGELSSPDRDLWQQKNTERVAQEHGEGADLIPHQIEITQGDQIQRFHNAAVLGLATSRIENRSWKGSSSNSCQKPCSIVEEMIVLRFLSKVHNSPFPSASGHRVR
jgi:hypothetical protein